MFYFEGEMELLSKHYMKYSCHCLPGLVLHSGWRCEPLQVCLLAHTAYRCPENNHK